MGKNILLIIDPQNDFHEPHDEHKNPALPVTHSKEDAEKIVELIESNNFDEIHVSLDTHTPKHIGHPGFYQESHHTPLGFYDGKQIAIDTSLSDEYLKNYNDLHKKIRDISYQMWPVHCIEGSNGHKIYPSIKNALDNKKNVKYHIKGQNELTEMYSIFSATVDPELCCNMTHIYSGENTKTYDITKGLESYEEACKHVNLNIKRNEGLINNLLGSQGENTVYVCGQAKSHCVADSIIDLLKANKGTIILVDDASSPVLLDFQDDKKYMLMDIAQDRIDKTINEYNNRNYETKKTDEVIKSLPGTNHGGGKKRGKSRKLKRKSSRKTKKNNRTKKMIKKNKKGNNTRRRHR